MMRYVVKDGVLYYSRNYDAVQSIGDVVFSTCWIGDDDDRFVEALKNRGLGLDDWDKTKAIELTAHDVKVDILLDYYIHYNSSHKNGTYLYHVDCSGSRTYIVHGPGHFKRSYLEKFVEGKNKEGIAPNTICHYCKKSVFEMSPKMKSEPMKPYYTDGPMSAYLTKEYMYERMKAYKYFQVCFENNDRAKLMEKYCEWLANLKPERITDAIVSRTHQLFHDLKMYKDINVTNFISNMKNMFCFN